LRKVNAVKISISLCILLGILLFDISGEVFALTVRINRPKIRLQIPSGGSDNGAILVSNPSGNDVIVEAYLEDWEYTDAQNGEKSFSPPGTTELSAAEWISFYPPEFTLAPYGSQEVFFSVKVPEGVNGGHYAVLFFETALGVTQNQEGVNILIKSRIGSLFAIEAGSINRKAALSDLSITRKPDGYNISAVLENTGNVDISTKGTFNIIDAQGMVYARGEFNDLYCLPGDKGEIFSSWSDTIPEGDYDFIITLDLGEEPLIKEIKLRIDSSGEVVHVGSME
jgi:hypothetical protein